PARTSAAPRPCRSASRRYPARWPSTATAATSCCTTPTCGTRRPERLTTATAPSAATCAAAGTAASACPPDTAWPTSSRTPVGRRVALEHAAFDRADDLVEDHGVERHEHDAGPCAVVVGQRAGAQDVGA